MAGWQAGIILLVPPGYDMTLMSRSHAGAIEDKL